MTAAHCTHGAVSSYAYLGAHNLYSEEDGRLIIFTQVMIMVMMIIMMIMMMMVMILMMVMMMMMMMMMNGGPWV